MARGQSEDIFRVEKGFVEKGSDMTLSGANMAKKECNGKKGGLAIEVVHQRHHGMDGKILSKYCIIQLFGQSDNVKCLEMKQR